MKELLLAVLLSIGTSLFWWVWLNDRIHQAALRWTSNVMGIIIVHKLSRTKTSLPRVTEEWEQNQEAANLWQISATTCPIVLHSLVEVNVKLPIRQRLSTAFRSWPCLQKCASWSSHIMLNLWVGLRSELKKLCSAPDVVKSLTHDRRWLFGVLNLAKASN